MELTTSHLFVTYFFIIIAAILIFLAISHILYQKHSPSSMISWLISVFFLPYVAVPLYFLLGTRKREEKKQKSFVTFDKADQEHPYIIKDIRHSTIEILKKNGMPPATKANQYQLITSDVDAYQLLARQIEAAQKSINICTYLFTYDQTTEVILEKLSMKAKEGIKVRLLLDLVGSFGAYLYQKPFQRLREAGGEVAFFVPFLSKPFQSYVNLRNHRKIYLFDRSRLLSGGMNLSNAYLGKEDGSKRWRDIMYYLEGPSVVHFYHIFMNDWMYATGETLPFQTDIKENFDGRDIVQVVPSGPDIPRDALYEAMLSAIYEAKERIWIVTPYFVPDENILKALIIAHHKGVDVKLITPKKSDHLIADLARSSYMRELGEAGIDVVLYDGEMLHAKAIIFDNSSGMVGSVNLDNRSLFFNYEVVTFIYSHERITQIELWMSDLMRNAAIGLVPPPKGREAIENIMKVFAPLL